MIIQSLFYIPTIISLLLLVGIIFTKNSKNSINRIFSAFVATVTIWLIFLYLGDITSDPSLSLFFIRLVMLVNPYLAYLFLMFVLTFPTKTNANKWMHLLLLIMPIFLSIMSFSPHYIAKVDTSGLVTMPIETGPIEFVYFIYCVTYFTAAFIILFSKYKSATILKRYQIKLVILATLLTVIVNVAYIEIAYMVDANSIIQLMYIPTIWLSVAILIYAVMGRSLFDIRIIFRNSLIYVSHYLAAHKSCIEEYYELQTLIYEMDSKHIALDFTGIKDLDSETINLFKTLKGYMEGGGKKIYFIGCSKSIQQKLISN